MARARRERLSSGVAGVLVGALLFTGLPALAGEGEPMVLGEKNLSQTVTRLVTRGGLRIDNVESGNPALILNVQSGTAPLEVNSDVVVGNLNSDLLDGVSAAGLIRTAIGSTDDATDANGTVVSATIEAPAAGYLIISGGFDAFGSTEDSFTCELQVGASAVPGTVRSIMVHDSGATDNSEEDCSTTGGTIVAAGSHTVTLVVANRETANLYGATVWVLFVPFDGNGNAPLLFDQ